ncbi:MAG: cell division protein ZipA C-terminal FtsZ-binding domain-containing protein [Rubrivivax sp.]|nr:cell division protein ZipA C-terminal FtsZ-binding domain-containing protein [Rubrivivax sp.]
MSELQIGLLAIGVVVVVAVFLFNQFQERRFRKQADKAFQPPVADPLASAGLQSGVAPRDRHDRIEPALSEPVFESDAPDVVVEIGEPHLHFDHEPAPAPAPMPLAETPVAAMREAAPVPAAAAPRVASAPVMAAPAPYDELIEYRVRIQGDGILASAFADAFNQVRLLGKAVRWRGLPVGAIEWEEVHPWRDAHYQQLVVTLQLADRNGAASEEQLAGLCSTLTAVANAHGLRVACDDMADALERAQSIDRFCVDVDVLIGLNVVARGEGSVNLARIVREAEGSGMVLGTDGVFQLLDSRGEPLYALCNHDAEPFTGDVHEDQTSQGVTLQFDVPRVPDGIKVFDGMVTFGRRLANEVGGILVDDNLRPLTDAGIDKIRTQLVHIYERMEARGVPSGSRRALRLFS